MDTTFFVPKKEILEGYANIQMDFAKGAGFYEYKGVGPKWRCFDYQVLFSGDDGCENIRQELQVLYDVEPGYASDSDDQADLDEIKWEPFTDKMYKLC